MENEIPIPPEYTPPPQRAPRKRKSRKGLIIAIVLIVVVLIGLIGTVFVAYNEADYIVSSAIGECTTSLGSASLTQNSIFLPILMKANMTISNPSSMDLHLNRFQANILIWLPSTNHTYTISSVDTSDKSLPSGGYASVPVELYIDVIELISYLASHSSGYNIIISDSMNVSGTWLFWTITKKVTRTQTASDSIMSSLIKHPLQYVLHIIRDVNRTYSNNPDRILTSWVVVTNNCSFPVVAYINVGGEALGAETINVDNGDVLNPNQTSGNNGLPDDWITDNYTSIVPFTVYGIQAQAP